MISIIIVIATGFVLAPISHRVLHPFLGEAGQGRLKLYQAPNQVPTS